MPEPRLISPEDMAFLARFADRCSEEVSRDGEAQPCDKPAVAARYDDVNGGHPYPVCGYHARGPMVSLAQLLNGAA